MRRKKDRNLQDAAEPVGQLVAIARVRHPLLCQPYPLLHGQCGLNELVVVSGVLSARVAIAALDWRSPLDSSCRADAEEGKVCAAAIAVSATAAAATTARGRRRHRRTRRELGFIDEQRRRGGTECSTGRTAPIERAGACRFASVASDARARAVSSSVNT